MLAIFSDLTEEIDGAVHGAVKEWIKESEWELDDYLAALDRGSFDGQIDSVTCSGDIDLIFTQDHKVFARFPVESPTSFEWSFLKPYIEVEIEGVFESELSN